MAGRHMGSQPFGIGITAKYIGRGIKCFCQTTLGGGGTGIKSEREHFGSGIIIFVKKTRSRV